MQFSDLLRSTRESKGVSLRELARRINYSPTYVSWVERGKQRPFRPDIVRSIASVLDVDPAPLLAAAAYERHAQAVRDIAAGDVSDADVGRVLEILGVFQP